MATTSPQGGTTSLPQYLQQRKPTSPGAFTGSDSTAGSARPTKPTVTPPASGAPAAPGAPGAPAPVAGAPTMTPHPVSSTGNPIIPPAPPAAVPVAQAPAVLKPGDTGQPAPGAPVPLQNLRGLIEQMLGNNNRYDDATVQGLRDSQKHDLQDTQRTEEDRLRTDAASRGVYRGSGLSTSLGDASQRYTRGLADAEANLQGRVADARAQDKQSAIGNAFQFGQGEMQNQSLIANILSMLAQQGGAGGPTIPGATGDIGALPGPAPADYSSIYQLLGTLFAPPTKAAA